MTENNELPNDQADAIPSTRTIAIGDIHGCDVALLTLLNELQPSKDDTVVILGDVVDRGPNSQRVIDLLMDLSEATDFVFVMGNHEEMMLNSLTSGEWQADWLRHGGLETLQSYGGDLTAVPPWHIEFLEAAVDCFDTTTAVYVHANLEDNVPLEEQSIDYLRWKRITGAEEPLPDGRLVICGHTPQHNGLPLVTAGRVCIDTYAYGSGGVLTALEVETGMIHQASQRGDFRSGVSLTELV